MRLIGLDIWDTLALCGAIAIVAGCGLWSVSLGLVVLGAFLIGAGTIGPRGQGGANRGDPRSAPRAPLDR